MYFIIDLETKNFFLMGRSQLVVHVEKRVAKVFNIMAIQMAVLSRTIIMQIDDSCFSSNRFDVLLFAVSLLEAFL